MSIPRILLALLLLFGLQGAKAQKSLTLDECIKKALANNLQVKIGANQQLQAVQKINEVRSNLLPQVSAGFDYTYYLDIPVQIIPASVFGGTQGEYVAAQFGLPQTMTGRADVSQILFNPQLLIGLKAAGISKETAALQLKRTQEDIVYNVSATYYNLLTLYKQRELLQSNLQTIEKLAKATRLLYENDAAKKTDVLRLEVNGKAIVTQLENIAVTEAQLLNLMKLLTGTPQEEMLAVHAAVEAGNVDPIPLPDSLVASKRTELQLLEVQKSLQLLEHRSIQASRLPLLVAFGSLSYNGYYTSFNPFQNINDKWYPATIVGLKLNVPIFEGGRKTAQLKGKAIDIQNTDLQLQLQKQTIQNEIDNAIRRYNSSVSLMKLQEENLALAQKVSADVQLQYKEGLVGISEVLNTSNELQKAQTDYLTALVSIRLAALDLKKALGELEIKN